MTPPTPSGRPIERDLGPQPLAACMASQGLKPADLVAVDPVHLTFKAIARACKGRRLTRNTQTRVWRAFNQAAGASVPIRDLFTYEA